MKLIGLNGKENLVWILLAVLVKLSGWGLYGQVHLEQPPDPAEETLGSGFISTSAQLNGVTLHYVRGGQGPAVVLIHGFPQDWFEHHAIMPRLAKHFTVIAIDLRGVGGSTATSGGYDDANMAEDIHQLITTLNLERIYIVGHDVGGHVASEFVRRYPEVTRGALILDTPIPGLRASGCTQIETGLIPGALRYVVEDQPEEVAGLIEQYASQHVK